MGDIHTNNEPALGKRALITVAILGIALVTYSIWSISRALLKAPAATTEQPSPPGSATPANKAATMNAGPSQEELEIRYVMAEQRAAPAPQLPVVKQPAAVPTNKPSEAVILQKAKAKVNQRIVERMKQYVRENPNRDTREIQEQIKKRESQGAQGQ